MRAHQQRDLAALSARVDELEVRLQLLEARQETATSQHPPSDSCARHGSASAQQLAREEQRRIDLEWFRVVTVLAELALVPTRDRARWIYFVQRGPGGPIKIGVTARSVSARVKSLQTGCAEPLRLMLAVPERDGLREQALHRRFRKHRQEGEWFEPVQDLLLLIDELGPESQPEAAG